MPLLSCWSLWSLLPAAGTAMTPSAVAGCTLLQRLAKVRNDVDQVFQPDGDTDHPLWNAACRPLLRRDATLRDRGRMGNQGLSVTQACRSQRHAQAVK